MGALSHAGAARADDPAPEAKDATTAAREEFVRGAEQVKSARWAEALASFERSAKLFPHPVTTYNIGVCERAMGHYTRARGTLVRALADGAAGRGGQLSAELEGDAKAYVEQIDGLLATADVTLRPENAAIAVDGRPLDPAPAQAPGKVPVLVAGMRPPGAGEAPPAGVFRVILDPGAHVVTLSRKGYTDVVVNRTFAPGSTTSLTLALDRLPASIHIAADQPSAVVAIDGMDVGVAPVDLSRPAGSYRLLVRKPGFVTYESQFAAGAGEDVTLRAKLPQEKPSILTRWWFWGGLAAVVAGATVATYYGTRTDPPPPERPALSGGGLGWTVPVK